MSSIVFNTLNNIFFLSSITIFIFVLFYSGVVYFNILVTGLSLLFFSILLVSIQIISNSNESNWKNIIISIGPILLTLASAVMFMYLLIKYKNSIIGNCNTTNKNILNTNNYVNECISTEYSKFSFISIILLIFQMILIYKAVSSYSFNTTGKIETKMNVILFLIGLINLLIMLPIYTMLTYFTADG